MSYRVLVSLFCLAVGAFGASDIENKALPEHQLLAKARSANGDTYSLLKSFVCREEIQRFRGDLKGSKSRSVDHVSTNLSFENGIEHYTEIRQNERSRTSLSDIAGAWSEGEFGTLLQQTGRLLEIQPVSFVEFTDLAGKQAALYRFAVMESESPWDLSVGTQHYRIPFTTDVWISAETGEILKISRKSISIPEETRISEIDWAVTLKAVDLSGTTWLLPTEAAYSVSYGESKRREWNQMSFSNYRRYGSESSLRFNGF